MTTRRVALPALAVLLAATPMASAAFRSLITPLSGAERRAMAPSVWREGCPVGLDDLRRVTVTHRGFDGHDHTGAVIVHNDVATDVAGIMRNLYTAGVPIRRMRPIQAYGGDDFASIEADNTSAFNCRTATGSGRWSNHAYGRAIDINPIENPWVEPGGVVFHTASRPYVSRRPRPGVAVGKGPLVTAFSRAGWGWGGTWPGTKDYQHFSDDGR